jgi:spermidine/putrescine transport system substrate-binding protein
MKTAPLLAALLACLPSGAADVLHVYTWADYLSPEAVERFEAKHDCRVVIDTFDSNESLHARLKAGARGYDLVFPTSYMVELLQQDNLLTPLDHASLPNLKHIDRAVLDKVKDREMRFAVPYTIGYGVIACRSDRLRAGQASWAMFDRADLGRRAVLLDDMRETLGAALKSLGHSLNSRDETELAAARDVVIRWKKNIAKFDNEGYKAGIDSGEFLLVHGYSGDLFQVAQENPRVQILVPREGVSIGCDEMVIPKSAPRPDLALKLINHLLEPGIAAENMEWLGYLCPNPEALKRVSADFLTNPAVTIPEEVKARSEVIENLGPDLAKWTKVWDEIKAAR